MNMKNRIKGYIISAILILLFISTAVMGYKKGYLNDVFRKDTQNIISKGSTEKTTVKTEPVYKDEVVLLNKGDSYILEYDSEKIITKRQRKRYKPRKCLCFLGFSYICRFVGHHKKVQISDGN